MAGAEILKASAQPSVRERLLAEAAELFACKGYSATTVREIVASSGVTKPVLYYYFCSKEGIYLELMREAFRKSDGLIEEAIQQKGSVIKRLLYFCDQAFSLFLENIKVIRVMYSIYYGPHQGAPFFDFDAYHIKIKEAIRRLVEEGIRKGEFRKISAEDLTWIIIGAISVATEVHLGHPEMGMGREGLDRVLKLVFRGISVRKVRSKGEGQ